MDNFWSQYWIPNSDIPDPLILLLFSIIHTIGIIYIATLFVMIKKRIQRSVKGPSPYSTVTIPPLLNKSLNLIFTGIFLVEFSNLKAHLSALLFQGHGYFMVAGSDIFLISGILLIPLGIVNLQEEMSKSAQFDSFRLIKPYSILIFIIVVFMNLSFVYSVYWFTMIVGILFFFSFVIYFVMMIYSIRMRSVTDNPVINLRVKIMRFPFVLQILLFISYIPFLPIGETEQWLTRTGYVEIFFMINEIFAIFVASCVYIAIAFPRWMRKLLGFDLINYLKYRDYRFDFDWEPMNHMISLENMDKLQQDTNGHKDILFAYGNDDTQTISEELAAIFNAESVNMENFFLEEYLSLIKLPKSDIIIISSQKTDFVDYLLRHIWNTYKLNIDISQKLLINNYYSFESEDHSFAFLGIIPSLWNIKRKIWLILADPKLDEVIINFVARYYEYYSFLEINQAIFSILHFQTEHGVPLPIPSAFETVDIPNQAYVHNL